MVGSAPCASLPAEACRDQDRAPRRRASLKYVVTRATQGSYRDRLSLPVADAAGTAGPDLDPRIEGLRVERVAVPMRQSGASGGARLLGARMRDAGMRDAGVVNDDSGRGFRFRTGLRALTRAIGLVIGIGLGRRRRECAGRPERLRREHGTGKIEAEELIRTILVRGGHAAPCQQCGTYEGSQNIFQDHFGPPEIRKNAAAPSFRNMTRAMP